MCSSGERERAVVWEAVAYFREQLDLRKSGVIAALSRQMEYDRTSFIEAILHDALNIYDVIYWAEQAGHRLLTQRKEDDGTLRVLIQPYGNGSH